MAMVRTQIQLEDGQYEALKTLSVKTGESVASLVRRAVDEMLDTMGEVNRKRLLDRALALAEGFESEHCDLAEQHDRHLLELAAPS